jgi:hypothetical protein
MYTAEISRRAPTAFVILIDQSGSMQEPFGLDATYTKAGFVADVVNKWIQNLVLRCAKGESVRDYFDIAIIGYGVQVADALPGPSGLAPISQIAASPLRVEDRKRKVDDGAGGIVEMNVKFPVWIEPEASGPTPMAEALVRAHGLLEGWCRAHPESYPPTVVNVTDGQGTDGDPRSAASRIRALGTDDGDALVFNCHISGHGGRPSLYPSGVDDLADSNASVLFEMSSELPKGIADAARRDGYSIDAGAKGFGYQVDAAAFIKFIEIGTRPPTSLVVVD